ncbi:MAG: peptide chain release factor N(5)-glutamine methyltransferase, partial [Methylobacteriaceae bacterium]|nr:peptide chain release factor N(5)-glutamine methyltransferase [Methylobacteriaceae bacterium]
TVAGALARARGLLAAHGIESAALDARLLLQQAAGLSAAEMVSRARSALSPDVVNDFDALVARRLQREPVSRILGVREFWGMRFALNPATLDPRPDTETLVDLTLALIPDKTAPLRLLDLGCGSGCIVLALLKELPRATGTGVDSAPDAVAISAKNAAWNGINSPQHRRATFLLSNWTAAVTGEFDIIVSNPPYIPTSEVDALQPEVWLYDPRAALDGGEDGLRAFDALFRECPRLLSPGGFLAVEIGDGQQPAVTDLASCHGFALLHSRNDYAGIPRAMAFRQQRGGGKPR